MVVFMLQLRSDDDVINFITIKKHKNVIKS